MPIDWKAIQDGGWPVVMITVLAVFVWYIRDAAKGQEAAEARRMQVMREMISENSKTLGALAVEMRSLSDAVRRCPGVGGA